MGADTELGERWAGEGALPGTACSLPGKAAENREKMEILGRVGTQRICYLFAAAVVRTVILQ